MQEYHYSLQLDIKERSYIYQRSYARGLSPLQMNLEHNISFQILRYRLEGSWYNHKKLTRAFLRFQQKIRKWLLIKKKALQYLRQRELGLVSPQALVTILD